MNEIRVEISMSARHGSVFVNVNDKRVSVVHDGRDAVVLSTAQLMTLADLTQRGIALVHEVNGILEVVGFDGAG